VGFIGIDLGWWYMLWFWFLGVGWGGLDFLDGVLLSGG